VNAPADPRAVVPRPPGRFRRWRYFLLGALAGGLLVVGLLSVPAVQGWLLRRAVATQPGWRVAFEHFGAGPGGVDVTGLDFAMPGVEARSAPIAVEFAPWRLFSRREFRIERIAAQKLRVTVTPARFAPADATAGAPPPSAVVAEPFGGVLALLQTAWPWALGQAEIDGEIVVIDQGQSLVAGTFRLAGGGVSAGRTGEFTYDVEANSALLPLGPANKVRSHGVVRLAQDADRRITRLTVEGDLNLPAYGPLALPPAKFALAIEPAPAGESYRASLRFGDAGVLEISGQLDPARARLTGRATVRADQSLAASLGPKKLPAIAIQGAADFSLNLRTSDLDVDLSGDLDARDWAALAPELAAVDAFKGRVTAALSRRAGKLSVHRLEAALHGANTPASLTLALTEPVDPLHPPPRPIARLTLAHWPADWANPWLTPARIQLGPAEFNGEWTLAPTLQRGVRLTPARPFTLGPVTLRESPIPALPPVDFAFSPAVEVSTRQVALTIADFSAKAGRGDQIEGRITATLALGDRTLHATGAMHGTLPTLLATADGPAPFTLNMFWDATQSGRLLRVDKLGFTARRDAQTPPYIGLRLLQPLPLDLDHLGATVKGKPAEWARLRFQHFPLGWISRWFAGCAVGGELIEGESVLRSAADGRLTLDTALPWRVADVTLAVGGRTLLEGGAQVAPALDFSGGHGTLRLAGISALTRAGNRIAGSVEFDAAFTDRKGSTTVVFEADLPALPHSAGAFGPLRATLRARSHNDTNRIAIVDELALRIANRDGELLSLEAMQPFLFGLSNAGVFTTGTLAPLRMKVGAVPLEWLRPWTGRLDLEGTLQPCDLLLTSHLTKYQLRALQPVHVRNFAVCLDSRELARDTEFSFYPGLDLNFICVPLPKFTLAYSATAYLTDGALDVGGRRAVDLDLAVGALGNTGRLLPNSIELSSRVDFGPLSGVAALAARGLPRAGTLVTRINGGLRDEDPVEVWSRLEGVPTADRKGVLPPFEFSAHGKLSPEQTLTADVALTLATTPQPTDARFEAVFNLRNDQLEISSGLHSSFFDAAAMLALATAFQPPAAAPTAPAAPVTKAAGPSPARTYPRLDHPFWGAVRGHFDLDIATLQYAPYRIDGVRGRLGLGDRELELSGLSGAMFAGRWSGQLTANYLPENPAANHELTGEFRIEQFDSARIVQTVFPGELASVEARVNVRAAVHSRGNLPPELIDRAEVTFSAEGGPGVVRLRAPKQDSVATAAVFGGALLLSPELRALGRLLKKFAEMPIDTVQVAGQRTAAGEVELQELRILSPQARLLARGHIAAGEEPLMERPLELSFDLAAKDETAVILSGMDLLQRKPDAAGYRPMKETFVIGGKAGQPDTRPLYDLLAKAVVGSKGTWGFLMRKMQDEVNKNKTPPPKPAPALTP
jgi:hypothetical protein